MYDDEARSSFFAVAFPSKYVLLEEKIFRNLIELTNYKPSASPFTNARTYVRMFRVRADLLRTKPRNVRKQPVFRRQTDRQTDTHSSVRSTQPAKLEEKRRRRREESVYLIACFCR